MPLQTKSPSPWPASPLASAAFTKSVLQESELLQLVLCRGSHPKYTSTPGLQSDCVVCLLILADYAS